MKKSIMELQKKRDNFGKESNNATLASRFLQSIDNPTSNDRGRKRKIADGSDSDTSPNKSLPNTVSIGHDEDSSSRNSAAPSNLSVGGETSSTVS